MQSFVVVEAKPGRSIPASVLAVLRDPRPTDVALEPDDHLQWADASGRLAFAGWQAAGENLGVLSRWEVRETGLTAFSGHVWWRAQPWREGKSWASQLADVFEQQPLRRLASDLDGVFAAASLAPDGSGCVASDPLGVAVLYIAETPDVTVVGTRAALVARAAAGGARPERDVEGAGWLAYASNLQTDRTTFAGVRTVPQGSVVRFAPGSRASVETWSAMPWLDGPVLDVTSIDDAIEESTRHMRDLVRVFASLPSSMTTLELTGGRDSRLILSLLLAEDLARDVVCITWGQPDLPDVVVATEIADRFDLRHRASTRPRPGAGARAGIRAGAAPQAAPAAPALGVAVRPRSVAERYESDIRHHVWLTSGGQSIWDLGAGSRRPPSPAAALTGQFGELLRTNYPRTDGIQSVDDLRTYLRVGAFGFDAARLLRPDVRRHYDDRVLEQLDALLPPGGTAQDAIDGFNQSDRLRRWFGTGQENDHRNRLFPLYSMPATRAAFGMGSAMRRREVLPFEVMRRCCDDLARMRFSGSQWPADVAAHLSDPSGYPTAPPVAPWVVPAPPSVKRRLGRTVRRSTGASHRRRHAAVTTAGEAARMKDLDDKLPVLRAMVDLDSNHSFFDLVDRRALHHALDSLADLPFLARRSVHDAVTTAMWLSGVEAPASDGSEPA